MVVPLEVQWEHTTQNAIVIFTCRFFAGLLFVSPSGYGIIGHLVQHVSKQSLLTILNRVRIGMAWWFRQLLSHFMPEDHIGSAHIWAA